VRAHSSGLLIRIIFTEEVSLLSSESQTKRLYLFEEFAAEQLKCLVFAGPKALQKQPTP
jgi:hypothetical protein